MDVLSRVVPFFILIGVGALAARARLLDLTAARALSAYVFWIAFPALLIHSLATMPVPEAAMAGWLAAYGAGAATALPLAILAGRGLGWDRQTRGGAAMASVTGNTAFLGAPLAISLFGPGAAPAAAAVVAVDCTVIMALATAALRSGAEHTSYWRAAAKTLRNPLVVASLLGAALCLLRIRLPAPIEQPLGLLRATASPVGLAALGVVIGLEAGRPGGKDGAAIGLGVGFKVLLTPVLVFGLVSLAGAPPMFRAVATLLAACPVAVSVFIQTRAYGAFERGGALAVVLSALATAVSLPLLGAFLTPSS